MNKKLNNLQELFDKNLNSTLYKKIEYVTKVNQNPDNIKIKRVKNSGPTENQCEQCLFEQTKECDNCVYDSPINKVKKK